MPRIARALADNQIYHIINRGNRREAVFHDNYKKKGTGTFLCISWLVICLFKSKFFWFGIVYMKGINARII